MERGDVLMAHQPNKRIQTLLGVGSGGYRTPKVSDSASVKLVAKCYEQAKTKAVCM